MKEKRDANIELFRILLMCTIPIYHLMLYNGVLYLDYHANTILGIVFASGAIPADYAFMAISSYYLQEKKVTWNQKHIKRILNFTIPLAVLYVVRFTVLRGLFGFHNTTYFVDLFLMKGAWWYAWGYLMLLWMAPGYQYILNHVKKEILYIIVLGLGAAFVLSGIFNKTLFVCDLVAFSFLYFIMGLLRKNSEQKYFRKMTSAKWFLFSMALYLAITVTCVEARLPQSVIPTDVGIELVKRLMGRYSLPAAILGVALFLAVRGLKIQSKNWITILADATMYVFLLHDMVMGVFWYFGKCWNDFSYYSRGAFCGWTLIYLVTCYLVAIVFRMIEKLVKRRVNVLESK